MIKKFWDFLKRPAPLPLCVFVMVISFVGMMMQMNYFFGCLSGFTLGIWFALFCDSSHRLRKDVSGKEVSE